MNLYPSVSVFSRLLPTSNGTTNELLRSHLMNRGYILEGAVTSNRNVTVYRARDQSGNLYAIKTYILSGRDENSQNLGIILRDELKMLRMLKEKRIKNVLYYTEISASEASIDKIIASLKKNKFFSSADNNIVYITMPLGVTYEEFLHWLFSQTSSLCKNDVVQLIYDLFSLLSDIHSHSIVHRDIKPQNILLVQENGQIRPKLMDFSISRSIEGGETANYTLIKFTKAYSSPEQLNSESCYVHATTTEAKKIDIYSMGLIAYKLINGNMLPFQRNVNRDYNEVIEKRKRGLPIPRPTASPDKRLTSLILRCLSYDNSSRPDLTEILAELNKIRDIRSKKSSHSDEATCVYTPKSYHGDNKRYKKQGRLSGTSKNFGKNYSSPKKTRFSKSSDNNAHRNDRNKKNKSQSLPNIKSYRGLGKSK